jgi:hypothetical protein
VASVPSPEPPTSSKIIGTALVSVVSQSTSSNAADPALLSGILALGFSQRSAQQILGTYSADQVRQVLQNLPHRNARNPAGYLLRELQAGDYAEPNAKRKPVLRVFGLPRPTAEEQAERVKAEAESDLLQQVAADLDPETRSTLWEEAKRICVRLGRRTVADDSPLLQAQFEILIKQRVLQRDSGERQCA